MRSLPGRPRGWRRFGVLAAVWLLAVTCDPTGSPTAPPGEPPVPGDSTVAARQRGPGQVFSGRARVVDPARFPLLSDSADLAAGRYRYRVGNQTPGAIERDDVLVSTDGRQPFVRLVLSAERVGDELVMETGPALWSDVINSGTYGITMPLSPASGPARTYDGVSLAPIQVGPATVPLPPLETTFSNLDVCKLIEDFLAALPGDHPPDVCGKERNFEVGADVTVSVAGTLDSLKILSGHVRVTGDMDIDLTVDGGGISGGRAPKFYPCYQAAYLGCLTTPTGAAFIDWIRQYVPALPEASLPPVRVCVPGLPVRTKAGYWYWTGWTPRWVPPVYEKCSVSDWGELPTIVLPSVSGSSAEVRPHIKGDLVFKVKGDGQLGLKIGIPGLSASAAYVVTDDFKAKASVGLFVALSLALKNGGATIQATFDDSLKSTQAWTPEAGWAGDTKVTHSEQHAQILALDNPDSVVVRVSVPVEASAELCIAIVSCGEEKSKGATKPAPGLPQPAASGLFDIAIGAKATAAVSAFEEGVWNRQVVNPADSSEDNWNVDIDGAYDLTLGAGVTIPFTGWILPQVPREWKKTWECCRVSLGDMWGRGNLVVSTTTTGANPDPDGYQVTVARYDTLPVVIEAGAQRLGKARDHGEPLSALLGPVDSVVFDPGPGPCLVYYSDELFFGNPVWGGAVAGLRALGVGVPTYAVTANCKLLIARYTVTLSGVSDDCSVTGGPVRDAVWLQQKNWSTGRSDTTRVNFDVVCDGTDALGALAITTQAATTPDYTDDYQIAVDGVFQGAMGPNATRTLTGLRAGTHNVALTGGPRNCGLPAPADVSVAAGDTVTLSLTAFPCALPDAQPTPGEVTVAASTGGDGSDADGYQVKLDGVLAGAMTPNAAAKIDGVPALVPSVIQVSNLAGNCRATTLNPFVVTLDSAAAPITVPFGATCTASPVDTVQGVVESSTWPTPAVSLRLASGEVRNLTGALSAELMQLAGAPVSVWGVTGGTSLDVYGYALASTLSDPRWVGIVTLRGDQVWLFGEEAVQLVDAPAGLTGAAGSLVWVSGSQEGAGVRPTAFGVIREAQP